MLKNFLLKKSTNFVLTKFRVKDFLLKNLAICANKKFRVKNRKKLR